MDVILLFLKGAQLLGCPFLLQRWPAKHTCPAACSVMKNPELTQPCSQSFWRQKEKRCSQSGERPDRAGYKHRDLAPPKCAYSALCIWKPALVPGHRQSKQTLFFPLSSLLLDAPSKTEVLFWKPSGFLGPAPGCGERAPLLAYLCPSLPASSASLKGRMNGGTAKYCLPETRYPSCLGRLHASPHPTTFLLRD